mgnify:FL=1
MYEVLVTPTFEKSFKKLDKSIRKRISEKIIWLADHPELLTQTVQYLPEDLKGLKKYRVGDWRILFWVDQRQCAITLYLVDHRRAVYSKI